MVVCGASIERVFCGAADRKQTMKTCVYAIGAQIQGTAVIDSSFLGVGMEQS